MVVKEEMVLLSSCSPPDEGIRKKQDNTSAFIGDKSLGKGTLFIAERYTVNGNIQVVPPLSRETSYGSAAKEKPDGLFSTTAPRL